MVSVARYALSIALTLGLTANIHGQILEIDLDTITSPFTAPITLDHYPDGHDYDLIGDRLSCISTSIPLYYNNRVYGFIKYFTERDRDYTRMVMKRATYYFPLFEKHLKENNMPDEIKYLAIIESGLNPRAMSRMGAVGLWQFMPYTGTYYGLHQDWYIDERMDPEKATAASFRYLKQLHNMFGDWELAMAAYNSGPGNVRKAIRRSGYKKSFWEIYRYLPRETRSYVPQWVAMIYAFHYAEEHNLLLEAYEYPIRYDTIRVNSFTNLQLLANQLNVCLEDLEKLNPHIKHHAIPELAKNYPLRIPEDKIEWLKENRQAVLDSANNGQSRIEYLARNSVGSTYGRDKVIYRVRSGDVLGTIAEHYKVRIRDIKKWNNLHNNLIRVGQRLEIWLYPGSRQYVAKAKPLEELVEETNGKKYYIVQPGDTLWDISRKFKGLTIEKIKSLNELKTNSIKPGQKLIIG